MPDMGGLQDGLLRFEVQAITPPDPHSGPEGTQLPGLALPAGQRLQGERLGFEKIPLHD
jgi:hypothetical protein